MDFASLRAQGQPRPFEHGERESRRKTREIGPAAEASIATTFVVVADEDGLIVFVNEGPPGILGWRAEDLIGRPISTIIPARLRDAHHLGFSRFLLTGQPTLLGRPLRLRVLTKDGRELDAEHLIVAERAPGSWSFGASIRPIAAPDGGGTGPGR